MNKQILSKKEETKNRMIDAAGRGFRQFGYGGIGVDGIAKEAGVTSGAFYAHLGSKSAAFNIAVVAGLDEVIEAIPMFRNSHGQHWIKAFAEYYLGKPHRDDLACGCAMASLTPEVVKADNEIHVVYEAKMKQIMSLIADGLEGSSIGDRSSRAWSFLSILIGGLNITRAMNTHKTSEEIAKTVIEAAIELAGTAKVSS
tara:strand:+ start:88306 stop:88902 length:597 start_codon:yes stop_codon:yes gene_type:complete